MCHEQLLILLTGIGWHFHRYGHCKMGNSTPTTTPWFYFMPCLVFFSRTFYYSPKKYNFSFLFDTFTFASFWATKPNSQHHKPQSQNRLVFTGIVAVIHAHARRRDVKQKKNSFFVQIVSNFLKNFQHQIVGINSNT